MATLKDAVTATALECFEVPDWESRHAKRPLLISPGLWKWVDNTPELHDMKFARGSRTLFEHLLQMFCDFRCADHLHGSDLRRMMPTSDGVWHMYPPGLRVYGWAPARHSFVAVCAATEKSTKDDKLLNDQKRREVLAFARANSVAHTIKRGHFLDLFSHES
jgi:hypothetical protein